ncbi:hypothetical protein [Sulfobacillus thermosulfidooxidans]|nr:hypothetical protein [Sulfobacillus thermosulfidooxidans]
MKKFHFYWMDRPGEYHWVQYGQQIRPETKDNAKASNLLFVPFWRNKL